MSTTVGRIAEWKRVVEQVVRASAERVFYNRTSREVAGKVIKGSPHPAANPRPPDMEALRRDGGGFFAADTEILNYLLLRSHLTTQ